MRYTLVVLCGLLLNWPSAGAQDLPGQYFRLMEAGAAQVKDRLDGQPGADLKTLESRPGWRHFPYAILAPAVLYWKRHPENRRFGDRAMLDLALRVGDLLAGES